jgi:hypothetical protein
VAFFLVGSSSFFCETFFAYNYAIYYLLCNTVLFCVSFDIYSYITFNVREMWIRTKNNNTEHRYILRNLVYLVNVLKINCFIHSSLSYIYILKRNNSERKVKRRNSMIFHTFCWIKHKKTLNGEKIHVFLKYLLSFLWLVSLLLAFNTVIHEANIQFV